LDFTNLYAFPKPGDPRKSILIMNFHPSAVVNPPDSTTSEPFAPEALYELKIDTDGDAVADNAYRVRFSSVQSGVQTGTLRRVMGAEAAGMGDSGQIIVERAPVSTGPEARVTESGDYPFFAGWRSDPFFFDVQGILNDFRFTGEDFFIDKDVCSIVLEMLNSDLGTKRVSLWASTLIGAAATGCRWTAARCPHRLSSSLAQRETTTWQVNLGTMTASFLSSRIRWSTRVDMCPRRQSGRPARSCPMCCSTTRRVLRPFRAMAERLPTMLPTLSWQSSQRGR